MAALKCSCCWRAFPGWVLVQVTVRSRCCCVQGWWGCSRKSWGWTPHCSQPHPLPTATSQHLCAGSRMNTGWVLKAIQVNTPQGTPALVQFRRCNISVYSTAHWKLILDELSAQQYMVFLPQVRCILPWFKYCLVLLFSSRGSGLINTPLTPQPQFTMWLHPNNYSWTDCTLSWEPIPIRGSVGQNKKPLSASFSPH